MCLPPDPISLCLSGGGYRAAAYHLGALRRLFENGLLERVTRVSSVSGGSIVAAHLAQVVVRRGRSTLRFDDYEEEVAEPFRRQILREDIRTVPVLKQWALPWNWFRSGPAARSLTRQYERHLTRLKLQDLPKEVEFHIVATDLLHGLDWRFERERAGDYKAGWHPGLASLGVAQAVAASSCFPPIFLPMRIALPPGRTTRTGRTCVQLTDGGVYDNLAVTAVNRERGIVLVSDGGAPFRYVTGSDPVRRVQRYAAIATHHVDKLNWQSMFSRIRRQRVRGAAWRIQNGTCREGRDGYSRRLAREHIGAVRTDLDGLTDPEIMVLENQGYLCAAQRTERYLPDLLDPGRPDVEPPHPQWMDAERARRALDASAKRRPLRSLLRFARRPRAPFVPRFSASE